MTPEGAVDRARKAIGAKVSFRMGVRIKPDQELPVDRYGNCDCSSFVLWALGVSKFQKELAWLVGGSLNVDQIWSGAERHNSTLDRIGAPKVGALVVYPARHIVRELAPTLDLEGAKKDWLEGLRVGHIGIVSEVKDGKATKAVHLHPLNAKKGSIIAETDLELFQHPATIYAWHASVKV